MAWAHAPCGLFSGLLLGLASFTACRIEGGTEPRSDKLAAPAGITEQCLAAPFHPPGTSSDSVGSDTRAANLVRSRLASRLLGTGPAAPLGTHHLGILCISPEGDHWALRWEAEP